MPARLYQPLAWCLYLSLLRSRHFSAVLRLFEQLLSAVSSVHFQLFSRQFGLLAVSSGHLQSRAQSVFLRPLPGRPRFQLYRLARVPSVRGWLGPAFQRPDQLLTLLAWFRRRFTRIGSLPCLRERQVRQFIWAQRLLRLRGRPLRPQFVQFSVQPVPARLVRLSDWPRTLLALPGRPIRQLQRRYRMLVMLTWLICSLAWLRGLPALRDRHVHSCLRSASVFSCPAWLLCQLDRRH